MAASHLSSKIEMFVACRSLPKLDVLSSTDAFVVVEMGNPETKRWVELGRTETQMDNQNPDFAEQFKLDYMFEEIQPLRFSVFDRDSDSRDLSAHDYIGSAETTLAHLMGARGQHLLLDLRDRSGSTKGQLAVRGEEMSGCMDVVRLALAASGLDKKDFFGKSDPFFTISRSREDGSYMKVHESEVIKSSLSPTWRVAEVPLQTICNADYDRPILIAVWDWNKRSEPELIGQVETSMRALSSGGVSLSLINPAIARKKKGRYTDSGRLVVKSIDVFKRPSLLDYIAGGCEINLLVAIDFTASNGAPSVPSSLHYQNPLAPNEYEKAIRAIGDIVEEYDTDREFPVFGFGGQVGGKTSHCFPLTFDPSAPEVKGVDGIISAYKSSFEVVSLSGPTLFAPIIGKAMEYASDFVTQEQQKYFVLLILTDGVINDMDATVAALVEASNLPLSIIIVGVGGADFSAMEALDGDDGTLVSRGRKAARDIVQFVPFRDYSRVHASRLARDTLIEVPPQLTGFFESRRIHPNPAKERGVGFDFAPPPAFEEGKDESAPAAAALAAGGGGGFGGSALSLGGAISAARFAAAAAPPSYEDSVGGGAAPTGPPSGGGAAPPPPSY